MNIEFTDIEIENFKNYCGSPQALDLAKFEFGLHFLRGQNLTNNRLGSNGSGKSSLWDAMCWCLYGKTVGGLRTTDIKPWTKSGPTWVSVGVTIDDIQRVIKRGASSNQLSIDGETVGQEQVDELIGLSYPLFIQAVILGQGRPLFLDLTPGDKMKLFSDVLDLERWELRAAAARSEASEYKMELGRIEGELSGIELALEYAEDNLTEVKASSERWSKERLKRVETYKAELDDYRKKLKPIDKEFAGADLAADSTGTELKALGKELDELGDQLRKAEWDCRECELIQGHANNAIDKFEVELNSLSKAKVCPTCGQTIKQSNVQQHRKELEQDLKEARTVEKKLADNVEAFEKTRADVHQTVARQRLHRDKLQDELDERLAASRVATRAYEAAQARVERAEADLMAAEEAANPYQQAIITARAQLKIVKRELAEIKADETKLGAAVERATFWAKGFGEIRLQIVDEVLTELQFTTTTMLAEVGLGDWDVSYSVERETKSGTTQRSLGVDIQSPSSAGAVRWESWSGGEGQRLRLVAALAFADVLLNYAGVQINMKVLDEPTRHLSTEGVKDLCEFLASYADQAELNLWYTDHNAVESAHFTSVVTVVNTEDGAYIEDKT